jgi:hypothetical protein
MTLWIDRQYANRLAPQLSRFKWKNQQRLASFRCPFCGDSQTSQSKTRGYFYEFKQELHFKCHNCNQAHKFSTVLKKLDPSLYNEYRLDCLRENGNPAQRNKVPVQTLPIAQKANLGGLPSIASLPADHIARQFVVKRQLPIASWDKLFYTDTWSEWVTAQNWEYEYKETGIPRILMPCYNIQGGVMMVQSRSLLPDTPPRLRYLTAKAHSEVPKVYGLERWDVHKLSYVVEGPFDSWFLPNCLAAMGSELGQVPSRIPTYESPEWVFVFDNEPRNPQILQEMERVIDEGFPIVIWPENIAEKDLNDMVLAGLNVHATVQAATYEGIRARLEFTKWKKR